VCGEEKSEEEKMTYCKRRIWVYALVAGKKRHLPGTSSDERKGRKCG